MSIENSQHPGGGGADSRLAPAESGTAGTSAGEAIDLPPGRSSAGFASHLPALVGCVVATAGPVLELGSGHFSTPVLHAACEGRRLVTADSDPEWMDRFRYLEHDLHEFVLVDDWSSFATLDEPWDVALVDNAPGHTRRTAIERLRTRTRYIVVHDTQAADHYGYEPLLSTFEHRVDHRHSRPFTTVVSDQARIPFDLPPLGANHVAERLPGFAGIQLAADSGRWREVELPTALPPHFFLRLSLEVTSGHAFQLQVLLRTGDQSRFFWGGVRGSAASPSTRLVTLASADLARVGEARMSDVERIVLRVRCEAEHAVLIDITDFESVRLQAPAAGSA